MNPSYTLPFLPVALLALIMGCSGAGGPGGGSHDGGLALQLPAEADEAAQAIDAEFEVKDS